MVAIGLLPTHGRVGPAAGVLLLVLRCLMAFSVGGEYSGVTAHLLEGAPAQRRGLATSFASAAREIGALMAMGVSAPTVSAMSQASLDAWGRRIPFPWSAPPWRAPSGSPARPCRIPRTSKRSRGAAPCPATR